MSGGRTADMCDAGRTTRGQEQRPHESFRFRGTPDDYRRMLPILEEAEDIVANVFDLLDDVDDDAADHAYDAVRALHGLIPLIKSGYEVKFGTSYDVLLQETWTVYDCIYLKLTL